MLTLQNISYTHANKDSLFRSISLTVNEYEKIAIIGNNGSGKSTLLKIIAQILHPSEGQISIKSEPYVVPQLFGQFNQLTIAQALRIDGTLNALKEILRGRASEENFDSLRDDWTIEARCSDALTHWQLNDFDLSQKIETLSGGQKTRVFLAGISIHQPELVLLDEPSNHLDTLGRELLYDFIQTSRSTLIVVSHDRKLLNLLDRMCELNEDGIKTYGGNYEFYEAQKQIENHALSQDIQSKEKALRKAREKERETLERQQKLDVRAKKNAGKAGLPKIVANSWKNNAERSTAKVAGTHADRIGSISHDLRELRSSLPDIDKMKFGFDDSPLHKGKILVTATDLNCGYDQLLWKENLNFQLISGERMALKGLNGSGKTTLIKLILGDLEPLTGTLYRADSKAVYIDQDYSLLDRKLSVYEQAQHFNSTALQEHVIKIRLARFLFTKDDWDKSCQVLSGGERMRLSLCCLTISNQSPDMIILDEPTNNLDIQNVEILTAAINEYQGTLIVVSHDETFLERVNISRHIEL